MQYVEYIQNGQEGSRGTGWYIDLGYTPSQTSNVKIKCKVYFPNSQQDGDLFIGASENGYKKFRFFSYNSAPGRMAFDCPSDSSGARILCNYTGVTEWEFGAIEDGNTYISNLTAGISVTGHSNDVRQFNIPFSVWHNGSNNTQGSQVYYIEIYENDVKVKSYLPVLDNSNNPALYEEIGGTYHYNTGNTLTVGPVLSSIVAIPSKRTLASTGETISIEVATENAWTLSTSGGSFLTFSSTGDTSGATITATAPDYSGLTPREEYLTFVDSVTGDEAVITIKQKKYQSGQPFYLGGDEVTDCYVGGDAVVEAYLGEDLVYSSGPFQGITIIPKTISFNSGLLLRTCKIKASESWTMTVPAWLTASTLTGNTGETVVSLSTTAMTAATSGTIEVVSTNYTASTLVKYSVAEFVNGIKASQMSPNGNRMLDTGIQPNTTTSGNVTGNLYYHNDGVMIGIENAPDNNDFRLFHPSGNLMMDFGNQRCYNGFTASDGTATQVDIDFGNCYFTEKIRGVSKASPTSFTGTLPSGTIKIDLACMSVGEIKFWTDGNLVFDGKAAKIGTDYGLYDVVSDTFITTNDFTIVEEQ